VRRVHNPRWSSEKKIGNLTNIKHLFHLSRNDIRTPESGAIAQMKGESIEYNNSALPFSAETTDKFEEGGQSIITESALQQMPNLDTKR
jgi:hypothetical protein